MVLLHRIMSICVLVIGGMLKCCLCCFSSVLVVVWRELRDKR